MTARAWLRVVLYRAAVQVGWLWLATVAWFAVWALPQGRWNREFDARAIATITSIHWQQGAEDPDLLVEYVFRANGREYTNHGIDQHRPIDIVERREVEVAYVSSDPNYSELRVPGIRSRYGPVSEDLGILGVFAFGGVLPILIDTWRARREHRTRADASTEPHFVSTLALLLLPFATLLAVATLAILYFA